ncbi:metal ABC transporter ATP-binding protein [Paenibacillus aurantius]|uniref:Metal ABC transporter ATP-binding protein n=1 Tax=Paenibacillus aurantius TaxID=2918900 RepID=A0AA96RDS4_9BACL|nr:metal ABC transporter ATP-binding protein [Paenibacillus aurantius]WNQ09418.1 metal ABC transporter ATP-binding protein [Paenibacillus aurantius]
MAGTSARDCHQHVIEIEDLSFSYEDKQVIDQLDFSVLQRDFVGLVGSNGAGKTTLLRMIVGLIKPQKGTIRLFGEPVGRFKDWERIGYVPQKNNFNPLFPATVREVVMSGLYGRKNMFRRLNREDSAKCSEALRVMGIEDLADRRIGQLSGGQQQRAFLARALINNPDLLILDEPTVGIDAETQEGFFHLLRHMHHHHDITFLMVSHDREALQSYLGSEPVQSAGKLKFYVKHTHDPEDCGETSLSHALSDLRGYEEVLQGSVR